MSQHVLKEKEAPSPPPVVPLQNKIEQVASIEDPLVKRVYETQQQILQQMMQNNNSTRMTIISIGRGRVYTMEKTS
jgi:hypothetical protein